MTAIGGTLERVGNDPIRDQGSILSLLPSIALHAALAALIWFGFASSSAEIQPPVTFISLAPAEAPAPPAPPEPLPPTGLRLPQPEPPQEPTVQEPPLDFAPPSLPEPESFPFDPNATREPPPPEPDALPIEKIAVKPRPKLDRPKEATPKPQFHAKPKPNPEKKKVAAPKPAPAAAPVDAKPATASAPVSPSTARTATAAPTQPAANTTQNAAISDAPVRVTDPNYAGACPISYPERARRRNQEGTVVIHALIGPDGKPIEVTVATSSGHRLLDEAAQDAIANCAFVPQRVGGRAVKAIVEIPIPFKLI